MFNKDLLANLRVPPISPHIQDVRAMRHSQITMLTTWGFPVTNLKLLEKLRRRISHHFMRNDPYETISDIYATMYVQREMMALEAKLDTVKK